MTPSTCEPQEGDTLFRCSLCGTKRYYRSTQKAVGEGWRRAEFHIRLESLWFCPDHVTLGNELNLTIEFSVDALKRDILDSVKQQLKGKHR